MKAGIRTPRRLFGEYVKGTTSLISYHFPNFFFRELYSARYTLSRSRGSDLSPLSSTIWIFSLSPIDRPDNNHSTCCERSSVPPNTMRSSPSSLFDIMIELCGSTP